jgi:hypothetical protein
MRADVGQAGFARRRDGRSAANRGPRCERQLGLPVPAAGEPHVTLDGAVVQGHHHRAGADHRGERRVGDIHHARARRPDQPREREAPMHRARPDVSFDHVRAGRKLRQREDLRPGGVDEYAHGQVIVAAREVSGQLHHRPRDSVRACQRVDPRVDEDRRATARHPFAPIWMSSADGPAAAGCCRLLPGGGAGRLGSNHCA